MDLQYYAHVRENANGRKEYQTVAQHLTGTAELCREFAAAFGAEADGELAGLSHDIGKCTDAFQDHLLNDGPTVDHATAGAMACAMRGNRYASACVAGHHGGLPDFGNMRTARKADGTFYGRMLKGREERYLERCGESGAVLPPPTVLAAQGLDPLQASFWTRMLYSCLVDADFLDTERFMNGERGRGGYDDIPTLLARLQAYIKPWQQPRTELNRLRCEILNTCIEAGSKPKGVYTLTVPTGGGKTVASLAFALRHAAEHGMQRVIYVIPYTSIIDQNARVFRDILGSGNVLEHHSGVQFDLSDARRRRPSGKRWPRRIGTCLWWSPRRCSSLSPCTPPVPPGAASCTTLPTASLFSTRRICCLWRICALCGCHGFAGGAILLNGGALYGNAAIFG